MLIAWRIFYPASIASGVMRLSLSQYFAIFAGECDMARPTSERVGVYKDINGFFESALGHTQVREFILRFWYRF